jgi:hypothetical protein
MGKKFDIVYESVVGRAQAGGYLPGDIIKFRPNYKSCDAYKNLPTKIQSDLDELVKSGLNIRVIQVGNTLSGVTANNQHKTSTSVVLTVAGDHGGGRHYSSITVSPDMIDLADIDEVGTGKVPDQFKRKEKINIKPEKLAVDNKHITRVTDKGNGKNTPTDLKLAGESTRIWDSMSDMAMLYESIYNPDMDQNQQSIEEILEEGWMDRLKTRGAEALGSVKGAGQRLKGGVQQAAGSTLSKAGDWLDNDKFSRKGREYSQQGQTNKQEGGVSGHNAKIQYLQKNIDKRTQSFVDDIKNDIKKLGLDIGNIEIVSGINDALNQLKKSVGGVAPPPSQQQADIDNNDDGYYDNDGYYGDINNGYDVNFGDDEDGVSSTPTKNSRENLDYDAGGYDQQTDLSDISNMTYSQGKVSDDSGSQPLSNRSGKGVGPRKGKVKKDPLAKYAAPEQEEDLDKSKKKIKESSEAKYNPMKNYMTDLGNLYETISSDDMDSVYAEYLNEGFLRRIATKLSGGFNSNPMRDNNRTHEFAKSVSLDAGKDIAKSFGGDFKTHANFVYKTILNYLQKTMRTTDDG